MKPNADKKLIGAGLLSAFAASLCCITPVLAFLSGATGLASAFSWIEPARPWLIALSVGLLAFAWYQKLKTRTTGEIPCACEDEQKTQFLQSKTFLGIVTILVALMMAFPWYGGIVYPEGQANTVIVSADSVETVTYEVIGMTCSSCEAHVQHGVDSVNGVIDVTADHTTGKAVVRFDRGQTDAAVIRRAIDSTGYKVKLKEELQ
ncbi:MAG: mercuric transport protein MerTP [Gammaproteobacteria bacterium]|nr:mercuric transport protein MerTP [Gammaproteobacteria bacterium]